MDGEIRYSDAGGGDTWAFLDSRWMSVVQWHEVIDKTEFNDGSAAQSDLFQFELPSWLQNVRFYVVPLFYQDQRGFELFRNSPEGISILDFIHFEIPVVCGDSGG